MLKVCELCGAEYEDHATYCNVCRKESLIAVETPAPPRTRPPPLVSDPATLAFVAALWLLGLGYLLGEVRPRSWETLVVVWAALTAATAAVCVPMRNPRMAVIFSALGLLFSAIYAVVVM